MSALCPSCEAPVSRVKLHAVTVQAVGATWNGVSYSCPSCLHVLSVGIDPIAIKSDLVEEIVAALRKH